MSEDTTTVGEIATEPAEEPERITGTASEAEPVDEEGGNREAAKYRRQLRDAEGERDALRDRLAALQTAEAERLASTVLHKAAGLWANGSTLADLLDEEGNLDAEKVTAAAESARDALGLLPFQPNGTNYVPGEGNNPRYEPRTSMTDVIMGRDY